MLDSELAAWLRLSLLPGIGRRTAVRLLQMTGSVEALFHSGDTDFRAVLGERLLVALKTPPPGWQALCERTALWLQADQERHLWPLGHPLYPALLLQLPDPPLLLHVHGKLQALQGPCLLGVVGSRQASAQGIDHAREFSAALAAQGVCIVSGLAAGVDGAAHEGSLQAGGLTVAVVGTGLDRVYPARHQALAHRIVQQGAIISEYALGTPPLPAHFPQRNRLIAGLSQGTLVVEATLQSGSLITAQQALEQGREVFAIPGSIHAPQSRGCHALIKQGAQLVESAQDILDVLKPRQSLLPLTTPDTTQHDPKTGDPLLRALGHDPIDLDTLSARTGMATDQLQARLLSLELEGCLARLPGGLFQQRGRG